MRRLTQAWLRRYARGQAAAIEPWLAGRLVLDLGAGEGYVAHRLRARAGRWVCSVDVGLFRQAPGPYVVYDGRRLPFADDTFDSTLVLLALHHCAAPPAVLDEALRVTRQRLLVMESVYRSRFERFWLRLLDSRGLNRWRHGGRMPAAGQWRRPEEWMRLFESRGLRVAHVQWLGSRWERLVHHPLLYVLDKLGEQEVVPPSETRSLRVDWHRAMVENRDATHVARPVVDEGGATSCSSTISSAPRNR